ncbi:MAG: hypothetical protein QM778_38810 [Myxococcales bacterium]
MNAPIHHDEPHKSAPLAPLHAASALSMLVIDWLMYGANWLLGARSMLLTTLIGSSACAAFVGWTEHTRNPDAPGAVWQKAVAAGLLVAIPFPIIGAAVGAVALLWAILVTSPSPGRGHRR